MRTELISRPRLTQSRSVGPPGWANRRSVSPYARIPRIVSMIFAPNLRWRSLTAWDTLLPVIFGVPSVSKAKWPSRLASKSLWEYTGRRVSALRSVWRVDTKGDK
jgi:hypothetical protein